MYNGAADQRREASSSGVSSAENGRALERGAARNGICEIKSAGMESPHGRVRSETVDLDQTVFVGAPARKLQTFSTANCSPASRASGVIPAEWGVNTTFSSLVSG